MVRCAAVKRGHQMALSHSIVGAQRPVAIAGIESRVEGALANARSNTTDSLAS
jgi:hypothetical protein